MRILHVIEMMASRVGGPVSVLEGLARAQDEAGHRVTICTTNRDHPTGRLRSAGNALLPGSSVEVRYFSVQFGPLKYSLPMLRYLRRLISSFDIVHVHGLYRFPPSYAATLARRIGVPYVITPHGALDPYLYARSSRSVPLKRMYERWFDLPNLQGAGAIHYTAEDERDRASFLRLRAPSFVIPNGIEWKRYETLPARGAFRVAQGFAEKPLVLFLGRLHQKKGLDLLIPAFESVRRRIPDAKLAIVGPANDGYGRKVRGWVAERGLNDSAHFVGHLEGDAILQAYVDADVFVLPSYTENFGMTVVEAMACGVPVVISDQVNIHAEVSNAGAGLVTRCDAREVGQALADLLESPARSRAMGRAGRVFARQRYGWGGIVEQLTAEYETVIERNAACLERGR